MALFSDQDGHIVSSGSLSPLCRIMYRRIQEGGARGLLSLLSYEAKNIEQDKE